MGINLSNGDTIAIQLYTDMKKLCEKIEGDMTPEVK